MNVITLLPYPVQSLFLIEMCTVLEVLIATKRKKDCTVHNLAIAVHTLLSRLSIQYTF